MSVSSGRMSRSDALHTLDQIQAAANEFVAKTPSDPANPEAADILADAVSMHSWLDASRDHVPAASYIRDLRTRVAALQAARFLRSETELPRISRAICVTAYGTQADDVASAAAYAEHSLGCPVRLQDSSHVRTATLTGTRYIFTSHAP